jgi:tRNA A-37 threonylcarbamoyl transferase component Bud32
VLAADVRPATAPKVKRLLPLGRIDPEILQLVLEQSEQGRRPTPDDLRARFPGRDADVSTVLAAVTAYESKVEALRPLGGRAAAASIGPGSVVGDFVVDGVLGLGAMGVVYRARQRSLGDREVALKVLSSELAQDRRFLERFHREASLAAGIHHPNLAEVYGLGSDADAACFAMRLIEGRTLHDFLVELARACPPGIRRQTTLAHVLHSVQLARQLADALATIHEHGLVHRDVKPANVMLEATPDDEQDPLRARPVLVDFGLLKPLGPSDLTGTRTLLGTPAYASPESQLGRQVDARADVFSCGALLYDLLTVTAPGSRPPASAGLPDARAVNPTVDARLAAILDMALQEDPRLRYQDGRALCRELDRYLQNHPVRALPTTALGRLRLWTARRPVIAVKIGAAVGVVGLVLAAALAWLFVTAGSLWGAASRGETLEREGDLRRAALAVRSLYDNRDLARRIPGLGDGLRRSAIYWAPESPMAAVVELLVADDASGVSAEVQDRARTLRYDQAHQLIRRRLFDPERPDLRELALQFLVREMDAARPLWRQRMALATWADLLVLEPAHPTATPELCRRWIAIADGGDPTAADAACRASAVAALSGLPEPGVFRTLVDLLGDPDPEISRLAYLGTHRISNLQLAPGSTWEAAEHQEDLQRWIVRSYALLRGFATDPPEETPLVTAGTMVLWFIQFHALRTAWLRGELRRRGQLQPWDELPPELAVCLDRLEVWLTAGFYGSRGSDPWRVPRDAPISTGIPEFDAVLQRHPTAESIAAATGQENEHEYEEQIWTRPTEVVSWSVTPDPRRTPGPGAWLDFQDRKPRTRGDWFERADIRHAAVEGDQPGEVSFAKLDRPGWSTVTLVSRVPPDARKATVVVLHTRAARWVLPQGGHARVAITVPQADHETVCLAPSGCLPTVIQLGWDEIDGADRIDVEVSVRSANTTYRVYEVSIEWFDADGAPVMPRAR